MRILCLGEGNFSFSLSLLNNLVHVNGLVDLVDELVCTSFDSFEEVKLKYPESVNTLRKLSSHPKIRIVHGVNAAQLLEPQLRQALEQREHDESVVATHSISASSSSKNHFDFIIFNFPHLGVEDAVQNSSLLAHFLNSASHSMHRNSTLHVSLTRGQSDRWRLAEMVERSSRGLEIVGSSPLVDSAWPGYEWKRHQAGHSFRARVIGDEGMTFRLKLKSANSMNDLAAKLAPHVLPTLTEYIAAKGLFEFMYEKLFSRILFQQSALPLQVGAHLSAHENDSMRHPPTQEPLVEQTPSCQAEHITLLNTSCCQRRSRKRLVERFTEGGYRYLHSATATATPILIEQIRLSSSTGNLEARTADGAIDRDNGTIQGFSELAWECVTCSRRFRTEQGARTHVYTQHVINTSQNTSEYTYLNKLQSSPPQTSQYTPSNKLLHTPRQASQNISQHVTIMKNSLYHTSDLILPAYANQYDHMATPTHGICGVQMIAIENSHAASNTMSTTFQCTKCNRQLMSLAALSMHVVSKHGSNYSLSSSSTKLTSQQINAESTSVEAKDDETAQMRTRTSDIYNPPDYLCKICGLKFCSNVELEVHLSVGQLPRGPTRPGMWHCTICKRDFRDQRALSQHKMYKHQNQDQTHTSEIREA